MARGIKLSRSEWTKNMCVAVLWQDYQKLARYCLANNVPLTVAVRRAINIAYKLDWRETFPRITNATTLEEMETLANQD